MFSLGLDASTTTCGWCISNENRQIVAAGFFDLKPFGTNREKVWSIINRLKENPLFSKIDRVNLEGALCGFSGPSSRTVVVKLAKFSAVLEYVLQDVFPGHTNLVSVGSARKQLFGKASVKGIKPKDYVRQEMAKIYDMSTWETKNKRGNIDKRFEDVLDAVVMSVYTPTK